MYPGSGPALGEGGQASIFRHRAGVDVRHVLATLAHLHFTLRLFGRTLGIVGAVGGVDVRVAQEWSARGKAIESPLHAARKHEATITLPIPVNGFQRFNHSSQGVRVLVQILCQRPCSRVLYVRQVAQP